MLLTRNNGRLARHVDNACFVVRTEVCSPESAHRETTNSVPGDGIEDAHAAKFLDDATSGQRPDINLTDTPDTDPCTHASLSWRNGDYMTT